MERRTDTSFRFILARASTHISFPKGNGPGHPHCLSCGVTSGGQMAIVNDYEAIARRLHELNPATGKDDDLRKWRSRAEETAQTYVESRRQGPLADRLRRTQQIFRRAAR